jgi:protein gp37
MSKTRIDWADYSINPVKGLCPMDCKDRDGKSYCYARRMYSRFKWNTEIMHDMTIWNDIAKIKQPSKIFVGSTMELFGKWIKDDWIEYILRNVERKSQHTFIFLTKQSYNLRKWKFPDNCWVGISTTGNDSRSGLEDNFKEVRAKVKFVSIEPLLDYSPMDFRWIDWVIVGRQTPLSEKTKPHMWRIEDICKRMDELHKPIFIKNNLRSFLPEQVPLFNKNQYELRQEFPNK